MEMRWKFIATLLTAALLLAAPGVVPTSFCAFATPGAPAAAEGGIKWEAWSDGIFARAKREKKFVILDLEAVWCHWCHVMDEKTYSNPEVIRLLKDSYIAVRVDQDSRPDLSNRYEDYGWPATIVFNSQGAELAKRSGYINPGDMTAMLKAIVKDPTPGPSVKAPAAIKYSSKPVLPAPLRQELLEKHRAGYDKKFGAWGTFHKFLDPDSVEFAMVRARSGGNADAGAETMARATLKGQLNLLDPVWGGVYQYSTDGDWEHKHFEKIMSVQAENLRIYSQAYSLFNDREYLDAAKSIHKYLTTFLMAPDGAFYTSQDADVVPGRHSEEYFNLADADRRKQGVPRVDRHIYARENGWVVSALCALYAATDDGRYLKEARRAADWVAANRALPGGGFRHDARDAAGPYLGDTLSMGRAYLSLYAVTADRSYLVKAEQAADFIARHFARAGGAGFATADLLEVGLQKPEPLLDENIMAARFANLLFHYGGRPADRKMAEAAMRYLATPEIARKRRILVAGVLLADMESSTDPAHVTVVGRKDDPEALALFQAALKYPTGYKRVEWWDTREGPLPHMDVEYPTLKKAAAFACANQRCSLPVYKPDGVGPMVDRLNKS